MWYILLIVVILLMSLAVFLLIKRSKYGKERKNSWIALLGSIISIIISFLLLIFLIIFPPYSTIPTTGEYSYISEVVLYETNDIETYKYDGSYRKIVVEYYYPNIDINESKTFPLVVFSHGGMGYRDNNLSLYQELASHGYVVATIDHTYQCLFTKIEGKTVFIDQLYMQQLQKEDAKIDVNYSYERYQEWMSIRMNDINYVIDYVKSQTTSFYKFIDTNAIGVMGHSLGGSAALGIGRARSDIKAVVALESPFMYDIIGVEDDNFIWNEEEYPTPVLNVYTDSSYAHLLTWKQYAKNYKLLSSTKEDVKNVYIEGTGHFSISDLALKSPIFSRMLNGMPSSICAKDVLKIVNEECLEFFNKYLK